MNHAPVPTDFQQAEPLAPTWIERGNNALWIVGLLWLEYVVVSLIWHWSSFATLAFHDPDDAMRLVQVRDFMAGQSWFDVSQHRVNPPVGGPMHWSRLVDMPIAGLILIFRPLVGQAMAESIACVTVPMLTLGLTCLGLFGAMRSFLGVHRALLCVALLVTAFPILFQMSPLRIDHHGWQIAMATGVLAGVIAPDPRKGGWIAGAAMAMSLHISSEGLPFAAVAGTVIALRYVARPAEWPRLFGYGMMLAGASAALLLFTHGWAASLVSHCDSLSPVYLVPLLLVPPVMLAARRALGDGTMLRRTAPAALAAMVAGAVFLASSHQCLAGPFQTLDPLVYRYWLMDILEGLPVWRQEPSMAAILIVPSLVGALGLIAAALTEKDHERRIGWLSLLGLSLGSFAVAALVMRAMSVAHLMALIGNAWIIARFYPRIQAMERMPARVLLTVALCALSPAALAIGASQLATAAANSRPAPKKEEASCSAKPEMDALGGLPAATLFAPIDLGPDILLRTSHRVIATGHHRNVEGIGRLLHAYMASPDEARAIVSATPSRYFLFCPTLTEIRRYERIAPKGLGAQMLKGRVPSWLVPVAVPGLKALKVYRIEAPTT